MSIHPMAALHARSLPSGDALRIALCAGPEELVLVGGRPGDADALALYAACQALLYSCSSCGFAKPVSRWTRDSAAVGLCAACLALAEAENEHLDGHCGGAPGCRFCAEEGAS